MLRCRFLALAFSLALVQLGPACVVGEEEDFDPGPAHEDDDDHNVDEEGLLPLVAAGGWNPPSSVRKAGDAQYVPVTGGGPWNGGANCSGGLLPGTRDLANWAKKKYAGVSGWGGYGCRRNTGVPSQMSVHGTGRAVDIFIPTRYGDADNAKGDPLANYLVVNAKKIGVQWIIWDRMNWGGNRSAPKLRAYTGPNPHIDHIHVELTPQGARRQTAWFGGTSGGGSSTYEWKAQVVGVNTAVNVRSGAGTNYGVKGSVPLGQWVFIVSGPKNGWYQIKYRSLVGWAWGQYLKLHRTREVDPDQIDRLEEALAELELMAAEDDEWNGEEAPELWGDGEILGEDEAPELWGDGEVWDGESDPWADQEAEAWAEE